MTWRRFRTKAIPSNSDSLVLKTPAFFALSSACPDATREAIFARVREARELYSPKKIIGLLVYPVMASLTFPGIATGMGISTIGVKTNIKYRLHLKIRL